MRAWLVVATIGLVVLAGGASARPVEPNDPAWPAEWGLRRIGLPQVWAATTGHPDVVVATVDTGVNPIRDLEGALVPGWDFVEEDAVSQDVDSHGSRVASVIAARGNDGFGMAGHCWRCRVMPIRVTAGGAVSPERIGAGIRYAVDHGARVVNVSLSHVGEPDAAEAAAVQYALDRGVIVVASAGNEGTDRRQYPAAYPGVLAVAATDERDVLYPWSSRGSWVQLAAPGCQVVTDVETPPGTMCGTSFTPAVVSGVVGLLLARDPTLTSARVVEALLQTALPVAGIANGRVDAEAAFRRLGLLAQPAAPRSPEPGSSYVRETIVETGTFQRSLRVVYRVGPGRVAVRLVTPHARGCALRLRAAGGVYTGVAAGRAVLTLAARVGAGSVTTDVNCRGDRARPYSLALDALFTKGTP